jgi:hypothetical protein
LTFFEAPSVHTNKKTKEKKKKKPPTSIMDYLFFFELTQVRKEKYYTKKGDK